MQVAYARDADGQVRDLKGTNAAGAATYAGVQYYTTGLKYRAFAAVRSMTYGDGGTLATQFDARLGLRQRNVAGVLGHNYSYDKLGKNSSAEDLARSGTIDATSSPWVKTTKRVCFFAANVSAERQKADKRLKASSRNIGCEGICDLILP